MRGRTTTEGEERFDQAALHVGIIMDGNGRWARSRTLPRIAGHGAGADAVRRVVEAAPALGVGALTLYAFSADNWRRPRAEVRALFRLLGDHLHSERDRCVREGVRIEVVGRRDRLPRGILTAIRGAEEATAGGRTLLLRVAIDYSARDAITAAAGRARELETVDREAFGRLLDVVTHARTPTPPVDLLIRTGGEQRLSDFLLWECAYAELYFTNTRWPDFDGEALAEAVRDFTRRERRYGGLPEAAAS